MAVRSLTVFPLVVLPKKKAYALENRLFFGFFLDLKSLLKNDMFLHHLLS